MIESLEKKKTLKLPAYKTKSEDPKQILKIMGCRGGGGGRIGDKTRKTCTNVRSFWGWPFSESDFISQKKKKKPLLGRSTAKNGLGWSIHVYCIWFLMTTRPSNPVLEFSPVKHYISLKLGILLKIIYYLYHA